MRLASDKSIWDEFNGDWESLAMESEAHLKALAKERSVEMPKLRSDIDELNESDYEGKTKAILVQVRIKQSFFRNAILSSYGGRCCITQISEPRLLVTSHIVPWKDDPQNRLNPRNGLCLSALHDKAFDRGLITITDDFRIDVSAGLLKLHKETFVRDTLIAIKGRQITLPEKFRPDISFLRRHREMWRGRA